EVLTDDELDPAANRSHAVAWLHFDADTDRHTAIRWRDDVQLRRHEPARVEPAADVGEQRAIRRRCIGLARILARPDHHADDTRRLVALVARIEQWYHLRATHFGAGR